MQNKLLDVSSEKEKLLLSAHKRRRKLLEQNQKRRLDNVLYIGFSPNELSDLPGFLEPPQVLSAVTNTMGFSVSKTLIQLFHTKFV